MTKTPAEKEAEVREWVERIIHDHRECAGHRLCALAHRLLAMMDEPLVVRVDGDSIASIVERAADQGFDFRDRQIAAVHAAVWPEKK